jgi:hypothetical protein
MRLRQEAGRVGEYIEHRSCGESAGGEVKTEAGEEGLAKK